jgi:nucleoside-diphosphate-sugar epimerase
MRTVAVTGASSQLGVFLLPCLQQAGFRVEAYSRKVGDAPVQVSEQVCWLKAGDPPGSTGAQALVSCGPLELAETMVSNSTELQRVIAFSTTSVSTKADSGNRAESRQMASIRTAEARLKAACQAQGTGLLLVRPTLIYGCGLDQNLSLLAKFGRRFGSIPVASNADGLRQPVHAGDLAELALEALLAEQAPRLESAACGGSTLSYREMVTRTAGCFEGVRAVNLPPGLFILAVRLASLLPAYRGLNAEMVRRQVSDLLFDDSPLREALGFDPRPFQPLAEDFEIPVECQKLQLS